MLIVFPIRSGIKEECPELPLLSSEELEAFQ
jgi:hypothetical protein